MITEHNARTMPQERYNGTWLVEKRLGMVVQDFREIGTAVEQLLAEATFAEFRRNVSAYKNYAIFEVPLILDQMMAEKADRIDGRCVHVGVGRSVCQRGLGWIDLSKPSAHPERQLAASPRGSNCRAPLRLDLMSESAR